MSERDTPQHRVEAQAARCRRAWRRLGPEGRAMLALALRPEGPGTARVWAEVLSGEHPLARWLDGDDPLDALPVLLPGGFSP
ncbi:hypothetical protein L6R53_31345, partial [Myxococcota bacterium]|nr:hypothetical protein [Myxococcota bacterium]